MRSGKGWLLPLLALALFCAMFFTLWAMERGKMKSRHGAYGYLSTQTGLRNRYS